MSSLLSTYNHVDLSKKVMNQHGIPKENQAVYYNKDRTIVSVVGRDEFGKLKYASSLDRATGKTIDKKYRIVKPSMKDRLFGALPKRIVHSAVAERGMPIVQKISEFPLTKKIRRFKK